MKRRSLFACLLGLLPVARAEEKKDDVADAGIVYVVNPGSEAPKIVLPFRVIPEHAKFEFWIDSDVVLLTRDEVVKAALTAKKTH